jgi:hypothetical protein
MNIFYLDENPKIAAQAMTDKHVIKMILESAQLLSTAHRVLDGKEYIHISPANRRLRRWNHPDLLMHSVLYKSTHINHPSAMWVRESSSNYQWLYQHFVALCEEYTKRYKKIHATERLLKDILKNLPNNISKGELTPMKIAISDERYHEKNNPIQSYRNYYIGEKLKTEKDKLRYYEIIL